MTESLMYFAIGFLAAVLIVGAFSLLIVIPLVHGRAMRLTARRLESAMPQSMVQIKANKDLLRAEFAISTRRLEKKIEKLETRNASQLVELSKKGDAIKHLGVEVHSLRDQLRAMKEELVVKAIAVREAERALSEKEPELANLRSALDERSALVDSQKAENTALTTQVQTLQGQLTQAGEEAEASEERRDAAVRDLSYKESELAKLRSALDERSALVDSQKAEIAASTMQLQTLQRQLARAVEEAKAAEYCRDAAERVLSEKESNLASLMSTLNERSALAHSQTAEIAALTMQVQTLQGQLAQAGDKAKATEYRRDAAERAVSEKESALVQLTTALNERTVLAESHKAENAALRMQARMLNERLIQAGKEARAVEECRHTERRELKAAAQNLMEERSKFEGFHRRVTDLVQQATAQRTEDEVLYRRVREEMENSIIEQSRLLNDSQSELIHLRCEIEVARKAENDLRVVNAATQNLVADNTKLQAALDRANGDRARLVHELANLKRRQADQVRAAERVDNAALTDRVNDFAAERARRAAYGRPSRRSSS
jgi:chromosome segregation ATPase